MASVEPGKRTMLQHALEYLAEGLPIFPICTPLMVGHRHRDPDTLEVYTCSGDTLGKTPLIKWGRYQRELPDEDDIQDWWTRWPNANIGMATGGRSGVLVLDADGTEARKECLRLGGLDATPTVWTGKIGGAHFHLKYPGGDVRNFARKLPGTDMRAQGGYVLLPPSLHASRNSYRWAENTRRLTPAPVPDWLLQLIEEGNAIASDMASGRAFSLDDVLTGVKKGERDDKLFRYACSLRAQDVPQDEAVALLREAARLCDPPFPESAAVGKVTRAYKVYPAPVSPRVEFDDEIVPSKNGVQAAAEPPPAIFFRPISELLAMPDTKPDWMVDQLFTAASNGWVAAEPKVGKSWIVLELAYCLSTATPFLGRFAIKQPRRVLYAQEEDSIDRVKRRLRQLIKGDPIREIPSDDYLKWSIRVGFKIDDLAWLEKLRQEIITHKAEVVIMDVFNRLHGSDENKQAEMTAILNNLTRMTNDYGCAFIIVHHNRKPQQGNEARGNQMIRGSGVLGGWGECSLYLRKGKDKDSMIVTPESKDAPEMDEFTVLRQDQPNGGVLLQLDDAPVVEHMPKGDVAVIEAVEAITRRGIGATVRAVADELGKDRSTIQARLTRLVKAGYLTATAASSAHNPTIIYALVSQ